MKEVILRYVVSVALTFLVAACAVGPSYHAPAPSPEATGPLLGASSAAVSEQSPTEEWWRLYDDPVLDQLVADALSSNTDMRVAVARLERARASLTAARADKLPQTTIGAGGGYERVPEMNAIPGQPRQSAVVDVGFSVAYEVDLFGRVKSTVEAARGDAAAVAADVAAVRVSIVADTARAYVDAASAASQLAVARHSVDLLSQSQRLTFRRYEAGRSSRLDVLRIGVLRDQQASTIAPLEAERQSALYRLATLTGRAPSDLPARVSAREATPTLREPIPVGDGATLLQRRPDIRAAERRLAAETARIGIAQADLYPRITFGGAVGDTGPGLGDLSGGGPFRFMVGPLITWTFPNQTAVRARIAQSHADASIALAQFDGVVLRALGETETALVSYAKTLDQRRALSVAHEQAEAAVQIVRARQREGQIDFLDVIDAERTAADADAQVAAADARVADAQIALFRALGGGWQSRDIGASMQ